VSNLEIEIGKIELKDLSSLEMSIKSKEEVILQLTDELNLIINNKNKLEEYMTLNTRLQETTKEIGISSQEVISQIEQNQRAYDDYSNQYSQATYMLNLLESKNELESLQKELINMTNKQANLNKMKGIILDVTNSALQDLVDNINNTTNNILDELFETGLSIELKLYKEMKGKQAGTKSKPYVNLSVSQNGNLFDLSAMSGGEAARISLALTIALAVIHPTPFVMLDEVMASLDMNLRENCIDVIKKYLIESNSSRCVIDVEHLFIEGYYDCIIPLGCC
jgi:DNA repair exonuclease SbcCD ATPase subunit